MDDTESDHKEHDISYTIESALKRDGYFIYSPEGIVSQAQQAQVEETAPGTMPPDYEPPVDRRDTEAPPAAETRARESVPDFNRVSTLIRERPVEPEKLKKISETDLSYDISSIVRYIKWQIQSVERHVIGREDIIEQLIYAILTGEHMLLLSRTGMAKSFLANLVFNSFENARVFAAQASKDQTPDNYFGPYDIEEFKRGVIRHNIKGSIIEANFVLLDEFFDASDVVLRSLLSVLNERKFVNGAEQIDVAIHTAIATANYMRMNEVTEAVLDRFCYKALIPEDHDMYNNLLIDRAYAVNRGKLREPETKIPFEQLIYLHNIIKNNDRNVKIELPGSMLFIKNVIINKYVSEVRKTDPDFFISPRKQAKMADFLRASAVLDERMEVSLQDIRNMHIALVTLNSYINVKNRDKSLKEIYTDILDQTLSRFKAADAFQQVEFLMHIRDVFQMLKDNPEKRQRLHEEKGLLQGLKKLLTRIFPFKMKDREEEEITLESLRSSVVDLNPGMEEVLDLKNGILNDFRDIF